MSSLDLIQLLERGRYCTNSICHFRPKIAYPTGTTHYVYEDYPICLGNPSFCLVLHLYESAGIASCRFSHQAKSFCWSVNVQMLYLCVAPILQRYYNSVLQVGMVFLILPWSIRFPEEGNKLEEAFTWLQSATGWDEEMPLVNYAFLKARMCLCNCLDLTHIKVFNIGIINLDCSNDMKIIFSDQIDKMYSVIFTLVSPDHHNVRN